MERRWGSVSRKMTVLEGSDLEWVELGWLWNSNEVSRVSTGALEGFS